MAKPELNCNVPTQSLCYAYNTKVSTVHAFRKIDNQGCYADDHKIHWSFQHDGVWYDSCWKCNQEMNGTRPDLAVYHVASEIDALIAAQKKTAK